MSQSLNSSHRVGSFDRIYTLWYNKTLNIILDIPCCIAEILSHCWGHENAKVPMHTKIFMTTNKYIHPRNTYIACSIFSTVSNSVPWKKIFPSNTKGPTLVESFNRRNTEGNKYIKKCSMSLAVKEMKIKTSLRFYLTPATMAIMRKISDNEGWQVCGEWAHLIIEL